MNYREYEEIIKDVPYPDTIEYKLPFVWLHPQNLPLGVTSIGDSGLSIIKIPERAMNRYGRNVPVITFSRQAFSGKSNITDIVLPQSIERFPKGAFEGCTGLKRITVPRKVKVIKEGTFAGCKQLEDVYFEGTMEEWNRINIIHHKHEVEFGQLIPGTPVQEVKAERMIFIPGNEAIFSANIHFLCRLPGENFNCSFNVKVGNKDISEFLGRFNVPYLEHYTWYTQYTKDDKGEVYIMIVEPKEWISKPDDDGNGLLKALIKDSEVEFPIPIETHNVFHEDVEINKDQDFELILECAGKPIVYKDEETYNKETNKSMHFESVIPVGLFSASRNESFVQSPYIILNGKVVKTYGNSTQFGFDESDVLYSLSCLGIEYDAVMHSEFSDDLRIKEGNIISCVYRVQGWPNQNDYSDK